ncbi:24646_t:CDS:2, partial [Cetraspora pellucida]
MAIFTLFFARVQIGSKVVAQFFYRHAKFCASHPIFMIVLEIFIVLLLCYPAFDTYYLNPVKDVNHTFFCDVSPSKPQILKETFADKHGARPLFYVEQVIIKIANLGKNNEGESASVLEKDLLLWILGLQEKIENAVIRYPSLSSSIASTSIRYTLSDICFKPFNSNSCLIHSPLDYWLNNADHLSHDSSIQATLSLANKIYLEKFIPLNSVFGNVVYEGRKIISADSIILTYFLKEIEDYNKGLTISIWKEIWNQIINDINTTFLLGDDPIKSVNMSNRGELNYLFFNSNRNDSSEFLTELLLFTIAYFLFFFYIILSSGRLDFAKSKFGLLSSVIIQVFASLIISLSIYSLFDVTLTFTSISISWKLLPFVFILIGIENMFTLIDAVAMIPAQLDVKERVAQGLEKVGYTITKTLAIWLLLLLICSMTNIDSIKEFCIFTSIAMIIIYILHMSFFVATLSIDLKRSELEILFNNPISNSNNDTNANTIPLLKSINYGRKISGLLVILIFLVAVPNSPYFKFAFDNLNDSSVIESATNINITFWETSIAATTDKFWDIMSLDKKDQFAIIQPTRELTLFYGTEHDNDIDTSYSSNSNINWKFITKKSLKTFILSLKFITVPAIIIIFLTSFLVGYSLPLDLIIRKTGKSVEKVGNKIILPVSSPSGSSTLCFATLRVITLRGRHSADVDLLCANFNGVIISTSTDRHITSWDGRQGIPLKKLERYMRRCETCKCDSTGGLKNCITWPVRAICMSEKIDLVAAGFDDGVVRVWDINSGQAIYILKYTVEDIEQMTPAINHTCEKVTCLQIVVPNLHSSYDTSESTSNKKIPSMILATYLNGYFREWDLISGQIAHTVFTNQKGGISCLFVVDDEKQNYIQDELHIFTGARDGSVKCWSRTVHNPEDESRSNNSYCKSMWKLLYTIPGKSRNAITSIAAEVVKTKKSCTGIVVTGAANGEVKVYDYLTGQPMVTLSCGTFGKHHNAKECGEQLLFQRKLFTNQDLLEKYGYELPDKTKGNVSHKDVVTNVIIHKLKEECCPCGNTVETSGFSITTSSLDEKVYFWQLIRNTINCACMVSNISDFTTDDNNNKDASGRHWDDIVTKFLGCVNQPGGSAIGFFRGNIFGARHAKNSNASIKRCHGAEGEWEVWILDTHILEPIERIDGSENYDIEFKVKTVPLVDESDLTIEEQRNNRKNTHKPSNLENVELKGFVRRPKTTLTKGNFVLSPSFPLENQNQNHSYVHNHEEGHMQGQVVDYRQRNKKRSGSVSNRVCPDKINNDQKSSSFREEDEMDEVLPFAYIRRVVKMGEYGIAVT